jgi:hypothetical protein
MKTGDRFLTTSNSSAHFSVYYVALVHFHALPIHSILSSSVLQEHFRRAHCRPGVVAQTCNPSYSADGDWKNHSLKPAWAKEPVRALLSPQITVVVHPCHPGHMGKHKKEDYWSGHKVRPGSCRAG